MLVDEGLANWNDPIIKHMPNFKVKDPYVTREITIKDILIHNTGVRSADFLWMRGLSAKSQIVKYGNADQVTSFRSGWEYNNTMYVLAGELIEAISGISFQDFMKTRIYQPLGMMETAISKIDVENMKNITSAHDIVDGKLTPVWFPYFEGVMAAGSQVSNLNDMSRWLKFLLNEGELDGVRLLKPETFEMMFKNHIAMPNPQYPAQLEADSHIFGYGLAWFVQDYRGQKMMMHTGSLGGATAIIGLLPEENLGVILYANADHIEYRHAFMYDVFDRYLGIRDKDWSADLHKGHMALLEQGKASLEAFLLSKIEGTKPSLPLESYVGIYIHDMMGDVNIEFNDGKLMAYLPPRMETPLEHHHFDTFMTIDQVTKAPSAPITFSFGVMGKPKSLNFLGFEFKK